MPTKFSKILLYISTSRKQRQEGRDARKAGNLYRERGEWEKAALSYAHYLDTFRSDFGIRVQLGHMFKEANRLEDAEQAYEGALSLEPNDGDLLLSLGHLRKRQNRLEEAAGFYRRAFDANGSSDALAELHHLPVTSSKSAFSDEMEKRRDPRAESAIAACMSGARLIKALGFARMRIGHQFRLKGLDPQLHFELAADVRQSPVVLLEIDTGAIGTMRTCSSTLFLNYGEGFQPHEAVRFEIGRENAEPIRLFLAAPKLLHSLRWDPIEGEEIDIALFSITIRGIATIDQLMEAIQSCDGEDSTDTPDLEAVRTHLAPFFSKSELKTTDKDAMKPFLPPWGNRAHNYGHWLSLYGQPDAVDSERMRLRIETMAWKPRFSFVMPTFNTPISLLKEILDAMLRQTYPHFEICIADDGSTDRVVAQELERYAAADARVRYVRRVRNGHISLASNMAAALASGDYIVLVDHDDLIPDYALFVVAAYVNRFPDARIFFSDEDKIDLLGNRSTPYFKSCYNQFLMYGHNMVSHLGVYHRDLFNTVGGFRKGMEGSQDYDLFLRCAEKIDAHQIIHIPHILYHWRQVSGSTSLSADQKDYAAVTARLAISGQFERLHLPLCSVEGHASGNNAIAVVREYDSLVSIIIHMRGDMGLLDGCLRSIGQWLPSQVEVLIVSNDSDEYGPRSRGNLTTLSKRHAALNIRLLSSPPACNLSQTSNFAASYARGTILCFLDEDMDIRSPEWLERARGLLAIDDIGIVGARLLRPDETLGHFGIVTGMGHDRVASGVHLGEPKQSYGYFSKHRMISEFTAVTAACLFIRKQDFDACGGFETELAAYHNVDLCLKIRALGRRVLCDPKIELGQNGQVYQGAGSRASANRDAAWMQRRWDNILLEDPYYSPNLSLDRPDFALAYPPRQPWPWQDDARGRAAIAPGRIVRAPRFFAGSRKNDRGYLAICAILKNEAINILEWIAYHHAIGVEKFYLYNNNSTDDVETLLAPLVERGLVDLIPWPINPGQTEAYDDFADRHRLNWTWAAFIDLDEFINPYDHESIPAWLTDFTEAAAIALQWVNFGPNGHDHAPPGLLLEAYTTRFFDGHGMHGHVKMIVRMARYSHARGPHSFHVHGAIVDVHGEEIDPSTDCAIIPVRQHQSICINHYYTRSRAEWEIKVERGLADHAADAAFQRDPEWLGIYEREAIVHDDRILKFAERTRQMLTALGLPIGPQIREGDQQ